MLASEGHAPQIFCKRTVGAIPIALLISSGPGLLGLMSSFGSVSSSNVHPRNPNLTIGFGLLVKNLCLVCPIVVGAYLCHISPVSKRRVGTNDESCDPCQGNLNTPTIPCMVWTRLVIVHKCILIIPSL